MNILVLGKEDSQYMHYVLERADFTLYDLRESPVALGNFRSILFQILFALYVAQETCEFMHNDLHPKARPLTYCYNAISVVLCLHNRTSF